MLRSVPFWVLAAVVALGAPCGVAADPRDDRAEEVTLYTNADLLQFGEPEPADASDDDEAVDRERQFVGDFLDREYSRVEADHRLALLRSSSQAAATAPPETYEESGPYFIGGYGGYYGDHGHRYDKPRGGYFRLPPYDLRTARHGYYVPARRFDAGRSHAVVIGEGAGRITRHAAVPRGGARAHGRR